MAEEWQGAILKLKDSDEVSITFKARKNFEKGENITVTFQLEELLTMIGDDGK